MIIIIWKLIWKVLHPIIQVIISMKLFWTNHVTQILKIVQTTIHNQNLQSSNVLKCFLLVNHHQLHCTYIPIYGNANPNSLILFLINHCLDVATARSAGLIRRNQNSRIAKRENVNDATKNVIDLLI